MDHRVATQSEWLKERKALLRDEKAFMRLKDYLAERRRNLPWIRLEKHYVFESVAGEVSLADLFGVRSQLIVYHFMFGPDWERGCEGCTEIADNFNGVIPYIESRDASFVAISRAPSAPTCSISTCCLVAVRINSGIRMTSADAESQFGS